MRGHDPPLLTNDACEAVDMWNLFSGSISVARSSGEVSERKHRERYIYIYICPVLHNIDCKLTGKKCKGRAAEQSRAGQGRERDEAILSSGDRCNASLRKTKWIDSERSDA